MGTSRQITERQLKLAKEAVATRVKALQEKGLNADAFGDDPAWRHLDARFRQVNSRLRKIAEVEAVEVDLAKRKEERIAQQAQEKAERKAPKKKAPKVEEKPAKKPKEAGGKDKPPAKPKKEKAEK
jgi:hypothetical protein